ncbi:MAG: hypothetical protein ACK6CU_26620, partial [Deltaproteobacteria bacterium]
MVTELGSEAAIHDVTVESSDWMTALTVGRGRIGERGGVPPGSMCSVSAEGVVTLVDAITRKRYRLEPTRGAASAPPAAKPASVPPPGTTTVKVGRRTVAFEAPRAAAATTPVVPSQDAAPSKDPPPVTSPAAEGPAMASPTVASLASPAVASPAAPSADLAPRAPANGAHAPARPVSVPPPARPEQASPTTNRRPAHTNAYVTTPTEGSAMAVGDEEPVTDEVPTLPAAEAARVAATPAAEDLQVQATLAPPAPSEPVRMEPPAVLLGEVAEETYARDGEPTAESPLLYRERHYYVPEGTPAAMARVVLEQLFAQMEASLAHRPKGKLVKMAVFDHRWQGQPQRPPLVALQWKDWRGAPEVTDGATSVQQAAAQRAALDLQRRAQEAARQAELDMQRRAQEAEAARQAELDMQRRAQEAEA